MDANRASGRLCYHRSLATALIAGLVAAVLAAGLSPTHAVASGQATAMNGKLGIASARYLNSDPARLSAMGAAWSYGWSWMAPPNDSSLSWVPMVWGKAYVKPGIIAALRRDARSGRAHYLLGFNEPDSRTQSDMSPTEAAELWPELESTGLILGSPAPAVPDDGWLSKFMKLAAQRHLRVNFIALHYYQDFTNPQALSEMRTQLEQIHREYNLPIWITEVGALNIRRWGEKMLYPATSARAVSYMQRLFIMLNKLPFVTRYAWYADDCWSNRACRDSSLFTSAGRLTAAGLEFENLASAGAL